jgi:hypothetical protein
VDMKGDAAYWIVQIRDLCKVMAKEFVKAEYDSLDAEEAAEQDDPSVSRSIFDDVDE